MLEPPMPVASRWAQVPLVEEALEAPALAVGGALVEEEVVAVEEVHDGIALIRVFVPIGEIHMQRAHAFGWPVPHIVREDGSHKCSIQSLLPGNWAS